MTGGIVSHCWESRNAPGHFILRKLEISTVLMGQFSHKQALPLCYTKLCALMKAHFLQNDYLDVKISITLWFTCKSMSLAAIVRLTLDPSYFKLNPVQTGSCKTFWSIIFKNQLLHFSLICISQGLYGSWKTCKVLEFYCGIFQIWKVLEKAYWSWKVLRI